MASHLVNGNESVDLQLLSPKHDRRVVEHDMQTNSLSLPSTSKNGLAIWGVWWTTPCLMVVFLLVGVGLAYGHHGYYQSLDGTPVNSISQQQWVLRIGFGFAFLVKVALAGSMIISFEQYLWTTMRKKAVRLDGIDALFSMTHNLRSFFNIEALSKAKTLTLIGLISWLVPFIAVVTPSSISVALAPVTVSNMTIVPTVDFAQSNSTLWSDYIGVGWPVNAAPIVSRTLMSLASSMQIPSISAPSTNSSYTIRFYGPSLKCQLLQEAVKNTHDFANDQLTRNNGSLSEFWNGASSWNGSYAFRNWWESLIPGYRPLSSNLIFIRTGSIDYSAAPPKNISCQQWNSSYEVSFNYTNGIQTTTLRNLTHLAPFNVSLYTVPTTRLPSDGRPYIAMQLALGSLFEGRVWAAPGLSSNGLNGGNLSITNTGIFACPEILQAQRTYGPYVPRLEDTVAPWMCRGGSIEAAVEDLSHNFTIGLLSNHLLSGTTSANVTFSSLQNYWSYHPRDLLLAYTLGIAAALFCLCIGMYGLWRNGYSASTSFSAILFTTRNADLDTMSSGHCLGALPLPRDVKATPLQFGIMKGHDFEGVGHATFGQEGTVRILRSEQKCA